jgi:hypothetical protein
MNFTPVFALACASAKHWGASLLIAHFADADVMHQLIFWLFTIPQLFSVPAPYYYDALVPKALGGSSNKTVLQP